MAKEELRANFWTRMLAVYWRDLPSSVKASSVETGVSSSGSTARRERTLLPTLLP